MKDLHDSKTIDMLLEVKKRGRPPKGDKAMTAAEKQRAYRQRRADAHKGPSRLSDLGQELEWWVGSCEEDRKYGQPDLARDLARLSGFVQSTDPLLAERIMQLISNPLPNSVPVSEPFHDSVTVTKRSVPPALYVHPRDPFLTWTGRGRKPVWVQTCLDQGLSLDDLKVS